MTTVRPAEDLPEEAHQEEDHREGFQETETPGDLESLEDHTARQEARRAEDRPEEDRPEEDPLEEDPQEADCPVTIDRQIVLQ
jgi:hypothetical protein